MTPAFLSAHALAGFFENGKALLPTLAAAALAIVLGLAFARRSARRRERLISPSLAQKAGLLPKEPSRALPVALALLVVLGTGLALARPRWGITTEKAQRKGADVVLLLDTSASMRASDVSPSRFTLARQAAQSLIDRLGGDRVALVACEGEAQVLVPLTLDAAAAGLFLDSLEPGIGAKPGTSLGAGIAAAADLFPQGAPGTKHCVLISDGEDLEGGVESVVEKAKAEGISIHTVFVGVSGRGAPVPEVDVAGRVTGYKSGEDGSPVLSRPDPDLLKSIAAQTGGSFSTVSPGRTELEGVATTIDHAARRPLSEQLVTNREERFQVPLAFAVFGAAGLLLLGSLPAGKKRGASKAAASLLVAAFASNALAQAPAPQASVPATAAPAPTPAPEPTPATLVGRIAARPPFTTARSEALAGKKALEAKATDEAIRHFRKEADLKPKDATGAYNLGTALSKAGNGPEALASLETARRASRGSLASDAAYNSGTTLYRSGDYEGAARAFRDALKSAPGDPDASWNYELCVRKAEEKKKQQQQQQQKQDQKQQQQQKPSPEEEKKQQEEKENKDFKEKAGMSKDKADQLLAAIQKSDLDEQKKRIAEQKSRRRVAKDW